MLSADFSSQKTANLFFPGWKITKFARASPQDFYQAFS